MAKHDFKFYFLMFGLIILFYVATTLLAMYITIALLSKGEASSTVDSLQALLTFTAAPLIAVVGCLVINAKGDALLNIAKNMVKHKVPDNLAEKVIDEVNEN